MSATATAGGPVQGAPVELEEARRTVLAHAAPLPAEEVGLDDALGRHLAEDVAAGAPVPGFDNSAMDGYAVRAADTAGARAAEPVGLRLGGESRAGHPSPDPLAPGEAIAISTGATIPPGADAVVKVEDTRRENGRVVIAAPARAGLNVRRAGEDVPAGASVLTAGDPLGAAELGVLAALGREPVRCHRRPRVAIVTSGDELVPVGAPVRPGALHDSNSHTLAALAKLAGAEVVSVAWTPDEPAATKDSVRAALEADVAAIAGGVSVGAHDHVKGALAELGVEEGLWRVALKPGGPFWFGWRGSTLAFGLPGNPVSAMVTFVLFVRPALARLAGGEPSRLRTTATLTAPCRKRPGRANAVRCRLNLTPGGWEAMPAPHQGSHVLTSMLGADCLALVPTESDGLEAGETVEVELLGAAVGAWP